jgi:PAS domain S-box-containing protein
MTPPDSVPRSVRSAAVAAWRARGEARRLRRIFDQSPVPMVMIDGQRRYVDANRPARLTFRLSLDELRRCAVDDLTPPSMLERLEQIWEELLAIGWVTGSYPVAGRDGSRLEVVYWAVANALPDVHLGAFAPARWPEDELLAADCEDSDPSTWLTPRESEVLTLAARGFAGPEIAEQLVLSPATVKTHFSNIYEKLGVRSRAAAVAKAMQLGEID